MKKINFSIKNLTKVGLLLVLFTIGGAQMALAQNRPHIMVKKDNETDPIGFRAIELCPNTVFTIDVANGINTPMLFTNVFCEIQGNQTINLGNVSGGTLQAGQGFSPSFNIPSNFALNSGTLQIRIFYHDPANNVSKVEYYTIPFNLGMCAMGGEGF